MTKNRVKFSLFHWNSDEEMPLVEFAEAIDKIVHDNKPDDISQAVVRFYVGEYEGSEGVFEIFYIREETDDEYNIRIFNENRQRIRYTHQQELNERDQLARLLKKYGPQS